MVKDMKFMPAAIHILVNLKKIKGMVKANINSQMATTMMGSSKMAIKMENALKLIQLMKKPIIKENIKIMKRMDRDIRCERMGRVIRVSLRII